MADWTALLQNPPAELVVIYDVGDEDGFHPDGRTLLTVRADRSVDLDNPTHGHRFQWSARLTTSAWDDLRAALRNAGFPTAPPSPAMVPPDETFRVLSVRSGKNIATVTIPWHEVAKLPLWKPVFEILDSTVAQTSQGKRTSYPDRRPGVVSDVVYRGGS